MRVYLPKYVCEDVDRHGNVRYYYRRTGQPKVRLPGPLGSVAFLSAYTDALASAVPSSSAHPVKRTSAASGSFKWLCEEYFSSAGFLTLAPRTQKIRRRILDRMCGLHGEKLVASLEASHVRRLRDEMVAKPQSANAHIKALRQLLKFGVEYGYITSNVAADVSYIETHSDGHHAWDIEEIRCFEKFHAIGTTARLAFALLFYTGQRRSDVVRLGRQHVRDGYLEFTQEKNHRRNPVRLSLPILPQLQNVIDASPKGDLTFLVTQFGKPFTSNGFGNRFRKWCDAAGLKQCSAHGLRKTSASIAAQNGATESHLKAIYGWSTAKEVTRYTRAANQKTLATNAMGLIRLD